jgi:DNA adenine methylase
VTSRANEWRSRPFPKSSTSPPPPLLRNESLQPQNHGSQTRRLRLRPARDLRADDGRPVQAKPPVVAPVALLRLSPAASLESLQLGTMAKTLSLILIGSKARRSFLEATRDLCYKPQVSPTANVNLKLSDISHQLQLPIAAKESLRPPLKWAGGKRWLVPKLRDYWQRESKRRLVEPFCGGLAITLGLRPKRALLNDVNPHLINFYRWLKTGLVISSLHMEKERTDFYRCRKRFNELLANGEGNSIEAAALFYYLNRTCFNGLCRFNRKGEFNVPFGLHGKIGYKYDFLEYQTVFAKWDFTCGDFDRIKLKPTDFVYADPPYDVEFTSYSKDGFTWGDQERTAKWLSKHSGPVILSNQATKQILELYGDLGYRLVKLPGPRRISCNGDRTPAQEVLAIRNLR